MTSKCELLDGGAETRDNTSACGHRPRTGYGANAARYFGSQRRARGAVTALAGAGATDDIILSRRYVWRAAATAAACGRGIRLSWDLTGGASVALVGLRMFSRIRKADGTTLVDLPVGDQDMILSDVICGNLATSESCIYIPWPNDDDGSPLEISDDEIEALVIKVTNNSAAAELLTSLSAVVETEAAGDCGCQG